MSLLPVFFAALFVVVNTSSIPSRVSNAPRLIEESPSPSPSLSLSPSTSSSPSPSQSASAVRSPTPTQITSPQASSMPSPSISAQDSSSVTTTADGNDAEKTPSASPSETGLLHQTYPPVVVVTHSAQAPLSTGKYLGNVGYETPHFQTECLKCCNSAVNTFSSAIPVLRSCQKCSIDKKLEPKRTGKCAENSQLGYVRNPTDCFYDRCHKMLLSGGGNCMCLGTRN